MTTNQNPDPITGPWQEVAFVQGDDYAAAADMGTAELAAHLLSIGSDDARMFPIGRRPAPSMRYVDLGAWGPWGTSDTVTEVTFGDAVYVLSVNCRAGYAGLCRYVGA